METKMFLPLLPLRDLVVLPHMVAPLFVGRTKSVNALADAMKLPATADDEDVQDGRRIRRQRKQVAIRMSHQLIALFARSIQANRVINIVMH